MPSRRPSPDVIARRSRASADAGVVVPLRSFSDGKARLATALDHDARVTLARSMADVVVDAAGGRPLVVVSSAPEVDAWCAQRALHRIDDPGSLDGAAAHGREWVRAQGLDRVVVVHADLPLATTLDAVADDGAAPVAVIVPDHRDDGSPVLALPASAPFEFAYGPGSSLRHRHEAERLGLTVRVARIAELAFDVDVPADLERLAAHPRTSVP